MSRIRRGGKRIRGSNGGRTRNADCCCEGEPIPCDTINDEPTRATWEVSYEVFGLTIGSETCGATCNSVVPLSGVIPYIGGGFAIDWYKEIEICSGYSYFLQSGIRCTGGFVEITNSLGVTTSPFSSKWAITWGDTIPESSFILGNVITLPRISSSAATASVCLPTPSNGVGTTCDFTVSVA